MAYECALALRIDKDGQTNFQHAEPALSEMDSRHTRTPDSRETDRFRLDRRPPFPSIPLAVPANNTPIEKELLRPETRVRRLSQGLRRALWCFLCQATRDSD